MTPCLCGCDPANLRGPACGIGSRLRKQIPTRWEWRLELKGTIESTRGDRASAHAEYQEAHKELKAHHEAEAGQIDQESVTP